MAKEKSFATNFITLLSGNGMVQLIPLLFVPVITRMFGAEGMAIRANFLGLATMIAIAAAGRYEMAIVLPAEKRKAMNLVSLSLRLILIVSFLCLGFYLFRDSVDSWYDDGHMGEYLIFIAPAVLLYALTSVLTQWLNREKKYTALTASGVARSVFMNLFAILFGYFSYGVLGLIAGLLIGLLVALVVMYISAKDSFEASLIDQSGRMEVAKTFKDFPLFNAPHAFVDLLFSQFILYLFITREFGLIELGLYSTTTLYVLGSMKAVGGAVGQLYFKDASEAVALGKDPAVPFFRSIKLVVLFAIPVSLLIFFFGPVLFEWFLGDEFAKSGIYAQIMIIPFCVNFIVSPVSATPIIFRKQTAAFIFSLAGYATGLAALFIGSYLEFNFADTLKLFAVTQLVYYIALFVWYISLIKKKS